jgi:hypothetical protein
MEGKTKCYQVSGGYDEHCVLVMATTRAEAKHAAAGDIDALWTDLRAARRPEFDAGIPSREELVSKHGWWFECCNCSCHVCEDDLDEGALFDDDDNPWCTECGPDREKVLQERERRRVECEELKAAQEKEGRAQVAARFPGAVVVWVDTRTVWRKGEGHADVLRVEFTFPGGRWSAIWRAADPDNVYVVQEDHPAWHAYAATLPAKEPAA